MASHCAVPCCLSIGGDDARCRRYLACSLGSSFSECPLVAEGAAAHLYHGQSVSEKPGVGGEGCSKHCNEGKAREGWCQGFSGL